MVSLWLSFSLTKTKKRGKGKENNTVFVKMFDRKKRTNFITVEHIYEDGNKKTEKTKKTKKKNKRPRPGPKVGARGPILI